MEETKTTPPSPQCAAGSPVEGRNKRANTIHVDLEAYIPLLEDTDATDAEKRELLSALYAIMASFIDLGFSLETDPCGQQQIGSDQSTQALRKHVYSSHQTVIERFEDAAGPDANAAQEGVEA